MPQRWRLYDSWPEPIRRAVDEHAQNLLCEFINRCWRDARPTMSAEDFARVIRESDDWV
jgi:hypothetical protein